MLVSWSAKALFRLEKIEAFYSQVYGQAKSKKIVKSLISKTIQLEKYPKIGQVEQSLSLQAQQEIRYIIAGYCKILYKIIEEKNTVLILTVFDTRQDPNKMLSEE